MVPLKFEDPCAAHLSHGLRVATVYTYIFCKIVYIYIVNLFVTTFDINLNMKK